MERRQLLTAAALQLLHPALHAFSLKAFANTSPPTQRMIETNGIRLNIAEQGEGPVVLLCHGFPESSNSWRHQMGALAAAGFHAVAPDMRGYGKSDAPKA